jgi:hypothetical protein
MTERYPQRSAPLGHRFAARFTLVTPVSGAATEAGSRLVPISYSSAIHHQLSPVASRRGLLSPFPLLANLLAIAKFIVLITWYGI